MFARYYGAEDLFRFLSVDPGDDTSLGNSGSWNSYSYVRNRPINANDPDGRALNLLAGGIGAGVGAIVGAGLELWSQRHDEQFNWQDVGASATGGAVTGGVAGLTLGAGLAIEVLGASAGAIAGGVTERGLDSSEETEPADSQQMVIDGCAGACGRLGARAAGQVVDRVLPGGSEVGRQIGKSGSRLIKKTAEGAGKGGGKFIGDRTMEEVLSDEEKKHDEKVDAAIEESRKEESDEQ
jgi:hypothetical protein